MLAALHPQRVSHGPSLQALPDPDELPRKLSVIARFFPYYTHFKNAIIHSGDPPGRSSKRQRVRLTDMPREGKHSPSRPSPPPIKSSLGTSDKSSSVSARDQTRKIFLKEGKKDRDRSVKTSSVAVAPSPTALSSGGAPVHKVASRLGSSSIAPIGSTRMHSPAVSALIQARIFQRRAELINKLMAVVTQCLDKTFNAMEAACDGEGPLRGRAGTKRSSGSISTTAAAEQSSMGQKRGNGNRPHESDGEDEGSQRDGGRTNKRTKTVIDRNKKFACPYYKRDPVRFGHVRTCSGPGWDEVHRIKEHLYRRHELPDIKCNRCYEYFDHESKLEDHQRMDVPCTVRERGSVDPIQGFTQDQKKKIMSRKKTNMTEVDRWKELYCILFNIPTDSPAIPSPFYESSDVVHTQTMTAINSKDFKACVKYCRREAPKVIRQTLEREIDRELDHIEERMKKKLARVIETSLNHLLTTFQSIKTREEVSIMPDPNSNMAVQETNGMYTPASSTALPDDMVNIFHDFLPGELDLGTQLEMDGFFTGVPFQGDDQTALCNPSFGSDSAYYTYGSGSNDSDSSQYLASPVHESGRSYRS